MGVSDNKLAGNRIENNDFFGLAVIDFCFALTGYEPGPDLALPTPTGPGTTLCRATTGSREIHSSTTAPMAGSVASAGAVRRGHHRGRFRSLRRQLLQREPLHDLLLHRTGCRRCRRRVPEKRSGLIISKFPTREPSRSGGGLEGTRVSLVDSIHWAPLGVEIDDAAR